MMKISGKGVIIILVFLVVIPGIVDIVLSTVMSGKDGPHFGMTGFLLPRYIGWLPVYIVYVTIVFMIIALIKTRRENSNPKK